MRLRERNRGVGYLFYFVFVVVVSHLVLCLLSKFVKMFKISCFLPFVYIVLFLFVSSIILNFWMCFFFLMCFRSWFKLLNVMIVTNAVKFIHVWQLRRNKNVLFFKKERKKKTRNILNFRFLLLVHIVLVFRIILLFNNTNRWDLNFECYYDCYSFVMCGNWEKTRNTLLDFVKADTNCS